MKEYTNEQLSLIYGGRRKKKMVCPFKKAEREAIHGLLSGFTTYDQISRAIWNGGTCLADNLPR